MMTLLISHIFGLLFMLFSIVVYGSVCGMALTYGEENTPFFMGFFFNVLEALWNILCQFHRAQ